VRRRERAAVKRIVAERIERLFQLADAEFRHHPERSSRYVELARKLSRKNKVPIPGRWKRRFCKKCGAFWIPGKNLIVRTKPRPQPHVEYICLECGARRRLPYLREKLKLRGDEKQTPPSRG